MRPAQDADRLRAGEVGNLRVFARARLVAETPVRPGAPVAASRADPDVERAAGQGERSRAVGDAERIGIVDGAEGPALRRVVQNGVGATSAGVAAEVVDV